MCVVCWCTRDHLGPLVSKGTRAFLERVSQGRRSVICHHPVKNREVKVISVHKGKHVTLIIYLLTLFQGDRGYEGPKGSRGPTGLGIKGDQVWWGFNPLKAQAIRHYVF